MSWADPPSLAERHDSGSATGGSLFTHNILILLRANRWIEWRGERARREGGIAERPGVSFQQAAGRKVEDGQPKGEG